MTIQEMIKIIFYGCGMSKSVVQSKTAFLH